MNTKEANLLRRISLLLGEAASLTPQNPCDIKRLAVAAWGMREVGSRLGAALAALTDEDCGGIAGAEADVEAVVEVLAKAKAAQQYQGPTPKG